MVSRRVLCATVPCVLVVGARRVAAGDLDGFARCLTGAGAIYYGASWCPHCAAQNKLFGTAFQSIRYVECSEGGRGI